ncbi:MAG TPA: hypothetical protein DGO89_21315 [Microcoleaceae bacterium UBA9251]|nr:hypothetical protein [Microcoleaceae cyanobacterium UBA9251]
MQNLRPTGLQPIAGAEWKAPKELDANTKNQKLSVPGPDRPDIPDGKGGDDSPARIQEHDPLSGTNSPISTSSLKVASGRSTRPAVPQGKPLKKSGLKKCLAVTLCLLPIALGAGFLGWRHSQQKSPKPEELLPAVRSPLSQNYLQTKPVNLDRTPDRSAKGDRYD